MAAFGNKDKSAAPTPTPAYRITDGAKSTWAKGSNAALTFKGDGALEDFVSVKVDGKVIDKENYTVKAAASTGTSSSPKTGDTENISIWLLLMMISAGGMAYILLDRRKKNYSK